MSEMLTERKALQDYIEWLKDERRRLGEEYWSAIERLRVLDQEVQTDISSIDMVNDLSKLIKMQTETVNKLGNLIPSIPVETIVESWSETERVSIETEKNYSKISPKQMEQEKDREDFSATIKRRNNSIKNLSSDVSTFLEGAGAPVKMAEIENYVLQKGYNKFSNPSDIMNKIMNYNPRIERAYRGYYQYRL